ncbi:MAG: hypothetical protein ACK40G_13780 [Cytophagaceae bacterium]
MALTLRLDKTELKELDKIMKSLGKKTASRAIKEMIMSYHSILYDLENQRVRAEEAEEASERVMDLVKQILSANAELQEILFPKETTKAPKKGKPGKKTKGGLKELLKESYKNEDWD